MFGETTAQSAQRSVSDSSVALEQLDLTVNDIEQIIGGALVFHGHRVISGIFDLRGIEVRLSQIGDNGFVD